jgi:hypothetical protein
MDTDKLMATTRKLEGKAAQRKYMNKSIRQEAMREQLVAAGHLGAVVKIAKRLEDDSEEMDAIRVQRLKAAADVHLRLISKFLPDLKAIEAQIESGEQLREVLFRVVDERQPVH